MLSRLRKSESGATAVLVAASMVLIMGMAALVVDYGLALSERRLDQNVADAAVMGGAIVTIQTANMANGVAEIKHLVDVNLGRTVDNTAWQACVDPDQLAFLPDAGNECISWETGTNTLIFRVRVPKQDTETTFGKILGVDTLSTDAFAEATLESIPGGKLLPFSLFAGAAAGTEACLKETSPGPAPALPPPCDGGPASGQFGGFDVHKYAIGLGFCQSTQAIFHLASAVGIDHAMSSFEPDYAGGAGVSASNAVSEEGCVTGSGPPRPVPNTVTPKTGNWANALNIGFIDGGTSVGISFNGRLGVGSSQGALIDWNGPTSQEINNEPIWSFFSGGFCAGPLAAAPTPDLKNDAAKTCLQGWSSGAIFASGFKGAQRVGFVPVYDESPPPPTASRYHINEFVPVYLQSVYIQDGGVYNVHSPGNVGTFPGSKLKALSAIVLDCEMLNDQPCDPETTSGNPFAVDLSTLLLSR